MPGAAPPAGRLGKRKASSTIVVVGTDAPLLPHQLDQLARRSALGVGPLGGHGEDFSGDICLAFSTAHVAELPFPLTQQVEMVGLTHTEPLYHATVQATEEAIVNALVAARTMTGINGGHGPRTPTRPPSQRASTVQPPQFVSRRS